ncbi:MAG: hemerythrin domain-containing protein [Alphaproteobacteria bacterium]
MLDILMSKDHAISLLKKDHEDVKCMFDDFKKAKTSAEKEAIIAKTLEALKLHSIVEEEIFYPTVRGTVGAELMNEADEEHHVAHMLIAELEAPGGGGSHRFAKFVVLGENIKHHIKEEENLMMPKAQETKVDFEALGSMMVARKAKLLKNGFPMDAETKLLKGKRSADTPAKLATKKKPKVKKMPIPPSQTLKNGRDLHS